MASRRKTTPVNTDAQIHDIDLSETRRKRFRVDGDNNRIIELNTSDAGIVVRLNELYPKMRELGDKLATKLSEQSETSDEKELAKMAQTIIELDNELRDMLDTLFDANVSEVCIPEGTTVDPFNGEFRFETLINKLGKLYETNLTSEFAKMKRNVAKHTSKYTKSHKR